jgi:hypothetical protein
MRKFKLDYTGTFGPGWLAKYREAWEQFGKPATIGIENDDD